MNHDEFAFFNQQLACMLREGIPLEGAIKQLCKGMKAGSLRTELELLESDLARGTPLPAAFGQRKLPEFYRHMVELGVRSNDLPGVLTLLADHYQRANALWSRLKGLMVYPLIVVIVSLGLTLLLSMLCSRLLTGLFSAPEYFGATPQTSVLVAGIWIPPVLLALLTVAGIATISIPAWRSKLRWRLPGFREASLAQIASALALMLRQGTPLAESLALAEALESNSPAGKTLAFWRQSVIRGQGRPSQWTAACKPFPAMFLWLVQRSGEDVAAGFRQAADIYQARASHRIEMALYGLLPVSILLLGQMVFWQVAPLVRSLTWMMNMLGGME